MDNAITVPVALEKNAYLVHCGHGIAENLGEILTSLQLQKSQKLALLSDETVAALHAENLLALLGEAGFQVELFSVPAGEQSKCFSVAAQLCEQLAQAGFDRSSCILALGGGVVGDLAGFVSAIFFRGIPYLHLPTTVLAQVDSSVGGKTGINLSSGKNLVGSFHQPKAVLADTNWLQTLPFATFAEGFAEIIKHAAIRDPEMLTNLKGLTANSPQLAELIARNVAIKAQIVVEDEKETSGVRAMLNFGHTIGHAIEAAAGYGNLLHGEAISLGIRAALFLSEKITGLNPEFSTQILQTLAAFQLPLQLEDDTTFATERLLELMARDKKFSRGENCFVLLEQSGKAVLKHNVAATDIRAAVEHLRKTVVR